jgi:battenin
MRKSAVFSCTSGTVFYSECIAGFWGGVLGGLLEGVVYINIFAEIIENVPVEDREFSLEATSVSDSAGIYIASLLVKKNYKLRACNWK